MNVDPLSTLPIDLLNAKKWLYDKHNLILSDPMLRSESIEYGACVFG